MTSSTEREISREMVTALHRSSGSYELVIGAIAAALVGLGIDALLGTRPIFTVLFALAGFVGATFSIWLQYTMSMEAESDRRSDRAEAPDASVAATVGVAETAAEQP